MTIAPNLLMQIRDKSAAIASSRALNQESAEQQLAEELKKITDQIPERIAEAHADGGSYTDVMTLIEGRDYRCPAWKDLVFSKSPNAEWLQGCAAAVFAWCEESGLQPFLAPYRGFDRKESRIVVQWQPARLVCAMAHGETAFVAQLASTTAAALAKKAAESARERVKLVRKTIMEMHREIDRVAKDGGTEVLVTSSYGPSKKPTLRGDSWTGDIIQYCESVGLEIRTETSPDDEPGPFGPCFKSSIIASWKANVPVLNLAR